jgi:hypothetical protein
MRQIRAEPGARIGVVGYGDRSKRRPGESLAALWVNDHGLGKVGR